MGVSLMKKLILLLIAPLLFFMSVVSADVTIPDRPLNGVYDPKMYLDSSVAETLADINSKDETQVGIYIVDTLNGETIEEVANAVARGWKIGKEGTNSGILIAVAIEDRKFRIETSNEASVWLTDSKAKALLNEVAPYMKEGKYSDSLNRILEGIVKAESRKAEYLNKSDNQDKRAKRRERRNITTFDFLLFIFLPFLGVMGIVNGIRYLGRRRRSNYYYDGNKKLYPDSEGFVPNSSWSLDLLEDYDKQQRLIRSDYSYDGANKLYPDSTGFIANATWTSFLIAEYYRKLEEDKKDRLKRSQYSYEGKDKLLPYDEGFVENDSWTDELLDEYENSVAIALASSSDWGSDYSGSSDTGSSWSSDDWGGGGFDGGGASGGW